MKTATALFLLPLVASTAWAFAPIAPTHSRTSSSALHAKSNGSRKDFLTRSISSLFISATTAAIVVVGGVPGSAEASYSAYSARERDWEERQKTGDIRISTPKSLRAQLREIVPMNSESSKVFCPNGTPSNVSPMMENRCNDQLAMPSVFGRSDDIAGNSIPGSKRGYAGSGAGGGGTLANNPQIGGFPKYVN